MTVINTRKGYCATSTGKVHYQICGQGPVLLLLHQASQSSTEYAAITPLLAQQYTVLTIDYPGHGQSDDPEEEPGVADYSAAAIAVLDELAFDSVHIGGHHSGGVLAIHLAVQYPQRVRSVIMSGVGIRTPQNVSAVLDTPMTRDLPVDAQGTFLQQSWDTYRKLTSPGIAADTTLQFFSVGLAARSRPYDAHFAFLRWDREPFLKEIRQPTLLMHGEFDLFAEQPEQLLKKIPDSQFVHIAGGGAFLFYEQPAACAAAISAFLGRLADGQ